MMNNKSVGLILKEYMTGKIDLYDIPIDKISWSLLGRVAINEPENFIDYIFYLCNDRKLNIDIIRCIELLPSECLSQDVYNRVFEYSPEKTFVRIPSEFRTVEMIKRYNELSSKKQYSNVEKTVIMAEKYQKFYFDDPLNNFRDIPKRYKTQEMCDDFFNRDPLRHFNLIPMQFLTQRMCNVYYEIDPLNNYDKIPYRFRNFFSEKIVVITPDSNKKESKIFDEELSQKEYDEIFDKDPLGNLEKIPSQYRTQRMYDIYADSAISSSFISKIPQGFRTDKMYIRFYKMNPSKNFELVPDVYKTQEMCNDFFKIDPINNINKVPFNYRTYDMLLSIFNASPESLFVIGFPEKIITREVYNKLFDINPFRAFRLIPSCFVTNEMCDKLFKIDPVSAFLIVSNEIVTEQMCIDVINSTDDTALISKILNKMDSRFKTDKLYEIIFYKDIERFFSYIPSENRTKKMYITVLKKNVYRYSKYVPKKFYDDEIFSVTITGLKKIINNGYKINDLSDLIFNVIRKEPSLINSLSHNCQEKFFVKEMYEGFKNGISVDDILRKYSITIEYIYYTLEKLKYINEKKYAFIKSNMISDKTIYITKMIDNIKRLEEIILSLGIMGENFNLSLEQKIKFVYLSDKYIDYSLEEIYYFYYKSNYRNEFLIFKSFFDGILKYNLLFVDAASTSVDRKKVRNNNSWLRKNVYSVDDGRRYVIDKLIQNDIPLYDVIVETAVNTYYNCTFDNFVARILEYDNIDSALKIKKRSI